MLVKVVESAGHLVCDVVALGGAEHLGRVEGRGGVGTWATQDSWMEQSGLTPVGRMEHSRSQIWSRQYATNQICLYVWFGFVLGSSPTWATPSSSS